MHLQALRKARWLNRWSYAQIVSFLGSQVLEVGSGLGAMSERVLDRRRLVCVDDTPMLVERLWQTYGHLANVTVVQGDAICLSENAEVMAGGAFDTVLCQNVLEHVEDDMAVLGEFQKVLLPGGIVALFVPNNPAAYGSLDRSLGHLRRYTVEEVARKLTEAGFTVLACHGFNRLGGLGWRVANGFGEKAYLRLGLCTSLFSWLAPVARLLDAVPFYPPNTIVAIARKK
jgi:SAM-dependent methyltransferase